jgi:Zn-dependent protease with chaperone function
MSLLSHLIFPVYTINKLLFPEHCGKVKGKSSECDTSERINELFYKQKQAKIEISKKTTIPREKEELIEQFIEQLNFDPKTIGLDTVNKDGSEAYAKGSLKSEYATIEFFEPFIEEIKGKLSNEHSFIIAHELGHLYNDDKNLSREKLTIKMDQWYVISFAVSAVGLFMLFPNVSLPLKFIASYLAASYVSKKLIYNTPLFVNKCCQSVKREFESEADRFAMERGGKDVAQGGKEFIEKTLRSNRETRKNFLENANKQPIIRRLLLNAVMSLRMIDSEGNNLEDKTHPLLTKRLKAIENYLYDTHEKDPIPQN